MKSCFGTSLNILIGRGKWQVLQAPWHVASVLRFQIHHLSANLDVKIGLCDFDTWKPFFKCEGKYVCYKCFKQK